MSTDPTKVLVRQSVLNAALAALKTEILGGAGVAYDTLQELKDSYSSADTALQALIDLKANLSDPRFTDARTPTAHTHPPADLRVLTGTTTPSATTFYRGDGQWIVPTNTTYTAATQAEVEDGTATTARTITAAVLKGAVQRWVTGSYTTAVTTTGQALATAASAAAARTAIGAGTSSLALGTTSATAKAGDWKPSISDVTGLTTTLDGKVSSSTITNAVVMTETAYNALGTKDASTLYILT